MREMLELGPEGRTGVWWQRRRRRAHPGSRRAVGMVSELAAADGGGLGGQAEFHFL